MEATSWNETGNIAIFTFVRKSGDVWIYPEAAAVKVALDNGEIMGFQGDEMVFNKVGRPKEKARLTEAQARKQVSPRLKIVKSNRAVIYNPEGIAVFCYEFLGSLDSEQYRVFINADTGKEEYIERIEKADGDRI
jgi:spore germination protein